MGRELGEFYIGIGIFTIYQAKGLDKNISSQSTLFQNFYRTISQ